MDKPMRLPLELILDIITCSLPAADVILRPGHPTTKLLLSFTRVCRETRRWANRYLLQHCVYLDTRQRLRYFLSETPTRPQLRHVTSIVLEQYFYYIDELPLYLSIRELLVYTCETLTKLIIDMLLRTCFTEARDDEQRFRQVLRDGFERLVNLEEFVSAQDELYLDVRDGEGAVVWSKWPKLKRMALWNVAADKEFWHNVAKHPSLEILVLSNPDCLDAETGLNIKKEYFQFTNRPLKVLLWDLCEPWSPRAIHRTCYEETREDGEKYDLESKMNVTRFEFPHFMQNYPIHNFQRYIVSRAEAGTLWHVHYAPKCPDIYLGY